MTLQFLLSRSHGDCKQPRLGIIAGELINDVVIIYDVGLWEGEGDV